MDERELKDVLRSVKPRTESSLEVVKKMLDGKERAEIVITERPVESVREISPPRKHSFFQIDGFISYLSKYGGDNTVILADPLGSRIQAVLNETADRGFEVIEFRPQLHPQYAPWEKLFGQAMSVLNLSLFLAEHRRIVTDPDSKELMLMFQQIRTGKSTQLAMGVGKDAVNGVMVETKIAGQVKNTPIAIPEEVHLCVPVFVETPSREIVVDLLVTESNGEVVARMASSDVIVAKVELFADMLASVSSALGDKKTVAMGSVVHGAWDFITD